MNSGFGGFPGAISSYGGGGPPLPPAHQNPHLNSGIDVGFGNQGPGQASYAGRRYGVGGGSQYGGPAAFGEYGGVNNLGSSMYRMPPSSVGMPTGGGYPDDGNYGLLSSGYQTQLQPSGPRVPPGGMYQPPYYRGKDTAYSEMMRDEVNQSIIISQEWFSWPMGREHIISFTSIVRGLHLFSEVYNYTFKYDPS